MIFQIKTHRGTVRALKSVGTVRFALKRKISVKTVKRKHLNRGRVRAFKLKSRKTDKKVRDAVRST